MLKQPITVFIAIVFTFLFLSILSNVKAATYIANPSDSLSTKVSNLVAGDVLILNDGVYKQSLTIDKSGTLLLPITIKAANDGGAIIDGDYERFYTVNITGSYVNLEGITARNGGSTVIRISGNNNTVKRVAGYNAKPDGNYHIWTVSGSNQLIEDCVGAGSGRYIFLAFSADNVKFRRCYARWTTNSFADAPRSSFGVYGASNVTIENSIGTHSMPVNNDPVQYTGVYITRNFSDAGQRDPEYTTIRGSIFYNNWEYGILGNVAEARNLKVENSAVLDTKSENCNTTIFPSLCNKNSSGIFTYLSPSVTILNSTIANNKYGLWIGSATNITVKNTSFVSNDWVVRGKNPVHNNLNFFGNTNLSLDNILSLNSTSTQLNPGYDLEKYGNGGYLFNSQSSALKGMGESGSDIGANILYKYDLNGQLTSEKLWPWPMEDRIQSETLRELGTSLSATWEDKGGLWKTLDGVYPSTQNPPPVPPPAGNKPKGCVTDYNTSGTVDISDLSNFGRNYKKTGISCDLDPDSSSGQCYIDIHDFSLVAAVYKIQNACI